MIQKVDELLGRLKWDGGVRSSGREYGIVDPKHK